METNVFWLDKSLHMCENVHLIRVLGHLVFEKKLFLKIYDKNEQCWSLIKILWAQGMVDTFINRWQEGNENQEIILQLKTQNTESKTETEG